MSKVLQDATYASICMKWKYRNSSDSDKDTMLVTNDTLIHDWCTIRKFDFDKVDNVYQLQSTKNPDRNFIFSIPYDATHINKTTGVVFKIDNEKVYVKLLQPDVDDPAWIKFCSVNDIDIKKLDCMNDRKSIAIPTPTITSVHMTHSGDSYTVPSKYSFNSWNLNQPKVTIETRDESDYGKHWKEVLKKLRV